MWSITRFAPGMLKFSFLFFYLDVQFLNIYHSVVKFEYQLKTNISRHHCLINPWQDLVPLSPTGRILHPRPNDGISLTEHLDRVSLKHQRSQLFNQNTSSCYIRSTTLSPHSKPPKFSSRLCQICQRHPTRALQLIFQMLSSVLQHSTHKPSQYAQLILNPYLTIILTFLATILKHHPTLERSLSVTVFQIGRASCRERV